MSEIYQYAELSLAEGNNWVYLRLGAESKTRIGNQETQFWQQLDQMATQNWRVINVYQQKEALCYLLEKLRVDDESM